MAYSQLAASQALPTALRRHAANARPCARAGRSAVVTRVSASAPPTTGIGSCHGGAFLSDDEKAHLEKVAAMIGTPGKGITACDEGPGTIGMRFEAVGVENTEENRRAYRQVLFESPGASDYLSAAILDPETLYQRSSTDDELFPAVLTRAGIVPGVKPHLKVYALPGQDGATVMQGLDSLAARCVEYKAAGCEFAKWRSPIEIDVAAGQPSDLVIEANMRDLARYALICQAEGLVPIVEPDISLTGDHDLETAVRVNVKVQSELFKAMLDHGVYMVWPVPSHLTFTSSGEDKRELRLVACVFFAEFVPHSSSRQKNPLPFLEKT